MRAGWLCKKSDVLAVSGVSGRFRKFSYFRAFSRIFECFWMFWVGFGSIWTLDLALKRNPGDRYFWRQVYGNTSRGFESAVFLDLHIEWKLTAILSRKPVFPDLSSGTSHFFHNLSKVLNLLSVVF